MRTLPSNSRNIYFPEKTSRPAVPACMRSTLAPCGRARKWAPSALAASTLIASMAAQAFDFGQLLPGRAGQMLRDAQRQGVRIQRDLENSEREKLCARVGVWLRDTKSIPPEVLQRRAGGAARAGQSGLAQIPYESWFLEDSRFIPMFGKAYDALSSDEIAKLQRTTGPNCGVTRDASIAALPIDGNFMYRIFLPAYAPGYARGVVAIRQMRAQSAAHITELSALTASDEGLRRYQEIAAQSSEVAGFLPMAERTAYEKALTDANTRVALPAAQSRIQTAIGQAHGYDGLVALVALERELRAAPAAGRSHRANTLADDPALSKKQSELAQQLVAVERQRIDALGSDLVGLERGVEWYRDYETRFLPYASEVGEFAALSREFVERRVRVIGGAQPALAARIRAAQAHAAVDAVLSRYLPLASDRQSQPGTQLLTLAAEQRDELDKRAILGYQSAPPVVANQIESSEKPAPALKTAAVETVAAGEPSESVMYDLVKRHLDNQAAAVREASESCKGGFDANDPAKAILCLSGAIGTYGGGAEAMRITRFEKLGCERASGKPGYVCDYLVSVSGGAMRGLGPTLAKIAGRGGAGQSRFLKTRDGWLVFWDEQ